MKQIASSLGLVLMILLLLIGCERATVMEIQAPEATNTAPKPDPDSPTKADKKTKPPKSDAQTPPDKKPGQNPGKKLGQFQKNKKHCGLTEGLILSDIVTLRHLERPFETVTLVVEDTNYLGAMPTYTLKVILSGDPEIPSSCFLLQDGAKGAKFHDIDLNSVEVKKTGKSAKLVLKVVKDMHLSKKKEPITIAVDLTTRSVKVP